MCANKKFSTAYWTQYSFTWLDFRALVTVSLYMAHHIITVSPVKHPEVHSELQYCAQYGNVLLQLQRSTFYILQLLIPDRQISHLNHHDPDQDKADDQWKDKAHVTHRVVQAPN